MLACDFLLCFTTLSTQVQSCSGPRLPLSNRSRSRRPRFCGLHVCCTACAKRPKIRHDRHVLDVVLRFVISQIYVGNTQHCHPSTHGCYGRYGYLRAAQQTCPLPCSFLIRTVLNALCLLPAPYIPLEFILLRLSKCLKILFRAGFYQYSTASAANHFKSGIRSLHHSQVRNGHIKRITDNDIQSFVLEILGTNVSTTFITCPADPRKTLGIRLPFLIMIVKNMKKYFTFEVQILDDKNVRRRFRASNFQSTTRVKPFICTMPMRLDEGWNQIQFNLADFTRRAYGTSYVETLRVQIHANCRIRRVYFADRLYSEDELPAEFKLYLPVQARAKV
ncbi:cilia- and flagella-associated protein 20 isoform X1 [Dermacentor silvarum]|nr:cilia- and flagella-associated protein 20 isoform X1 [Dermacentor silvarum]